MRPPRGRHKTGEHYHKPATLPAVSNSESCVAASYAKASHFGKQSGRQVVESIYHWHHELMLRELVHHEILPFSISLEEKVFIPSRKRQALHDSV